MRQQTYLIRKGARYHFRRRMFCEPEKRPITISLNTADPAEARRLARWLAAKWDEIMMLMIPEIERKHLTIEEQEALFRKGLKDELARATAHRTAPIGAVDTQTKLHRIMEAAYRIVARVPHDSDAICADIIEAEINETWTGAEVQLLIKTLKFMVTPMSVSRTESKQSLAELGTPLNNGTIAEARAHILRGHAEAHNRAELLTNPESGITSNMVPLLLNDEKVAQARASIRQRPEVEPPAKNETNLFFARTTDVRFSEQIDDLHQVLFEKNDWQPDDGKTMHMLKVFSWLTGDKKMSDYEPADIDEYARRLARIPKGFNWGTDENPGEMATPYSPERFNEMPPPKERRSIRTNNSHFSKMEKAAEILKKTHWLPRQGYGQVITFEDARKRVIVDETEPPRVPLKEENLIALYGLPIWQGGGGKAQRLKPSHNPTIYQDAAYWVPLIATYSGMSREEVCGLEAIDFDFDVETPFMLVRANMTKSKDGVTAAGLKRPSRKRALPIHPELLRLNLQRYVERMSSEGHEMIFPELYGFSNKLGEFEAFKKKGGKRFYPIAWRYMIDAAHAIEPLPATKDGKHADFHSQRTFVFSAMASEEVSDALLARQVGHSQKGTGNKNYNRRALALGEEKELAERLKVLVREIPNVTQNIAAATELNLLHLNHRSKVGSAPGRNAADRFLA